MSSISSISSGVNPYQSGASNPFATFRNDLKSLASSVNSGNFASAQTALTSVQNDIQSLPTPPGGSTSPTGSASTIQNDLKAIQTAIQSSDKSGAQTAFSKLKTDLQNIRGHHGHHGGGTPPVKQNDGDGDDGSTAASVSGSTTSNNIVNTLLNAVQTAGTAATGVSINQLG